MRKKWMILSCLAIILMACKDNNNNQTLDTNKQFQQVENSNPLPKEDASNNEIAAHLAQLANRVPDVNEATAIIAGPYAIVAIDVDETLERERVGTVKYSVSEALYKDPYGKSAVVIADADLIERFRQMGQQISDGFPIQGIVDELAAIVGRYMPVMPNKEAPRKQQDEDVNDEDSKLDDIQEEQSNSDRYD
ncbi:MAG TPA: YhcN/YlaJ family sporulation lipoprotein [Bacillota bacterium]|nr:YhcN/YlaJ family sporulation lipoprotein [Bacillota bacterium]